MSYQNDIFLDNCVMRLVQIARAIRYQAQINQINDALASRELDAEELECQLFDTCVE